MAAEFGDIKRKDIPQYPVKAIREVLINALIHANYEMRGSRFFVAIYDDRLEIQNPGNFPPGMTIEDFKAGISKIRNPTVARVFREKENLEAWGSGYERICTICNKEGYPLPDWEEAGPVTRAIFYPIKASSGASTEACEVTSIRLNETELRILQLCIEEPMGRASIVEALGHKSLSGSIKQALGNLKSTGLIELTIPDKPNSKNQQCKITALGKTLLN